MARWSPSICANSARDGVGVVAASGAPRWLASHSSATRFRDVVRAGSRAREQQHAQALAQHALPTGEVDDARVALLAIERALHEELSRDEQPRDREQRADVAKGERTGERIAQRDSERT